eukprot:TRINITY_DN650_c0_g1_i1.p1 TRINITY_DN650_c0_g1~~TRINITY_DN650_c0_g1_i1.p1  ORF type:complete len:255 (-),score=50.43 TRINITY_DN650_c0_g1_i1:29-793(-)
MDVSPKKTRSRSTTLRNGAGGSMSKLFNFIEKTEKENVEKRLFENAIQQDDCSSSKKRKIPPPPEDIIIVADDEPNSSVQVPRPHKKMKEMQTLSRENEQEPSRIQQLERANADLINILKKREAEIYALKQQLHVERTGNLRLSVLCDLDYALDKKDQKMFKSIQAITEKYCRAFDDHMSAKHFHEAITILEALSDWYISCFSDLARLKYRPKSEVRMISQRWKTPDFGPISELSARDEWSAFLKKNRFLSPSV